jgi:hypothetical protein
LIGQQPAEEGQQRIGYAAEGASVGFSALAQPPVGEPGARIVTPVRVGCVEEGFAKAAVAGSAHAHQASLAALPGDRGHPGQGAQKMIVSILPRLIGLGEHRSNATSPDSWHGTENRDATVLGKALIGG